MPIAPHCSAAGGSSTPGASNAVRQWASSEPPLMPEVADAGEDHGEAALVGGGYDLVVPH
jgi:hypothetical protein